MTRRRDRGHHPRCYDRVVDEVTAADGFHDRLIARTLANMDASMIWRMLAASNDETSPMHAQAMEDFALRVRSRLLTALATEVGCPWLTGGARRLEKDDTHWETWRRIEGHVPACPTCSTFLNKASLGDPKESDILQLLRSPALARRLLTEAASADKGPQAYIPGTGFVISLQAALEAVERGPAPGCSSARPKEVL